MQIGDTVAFLKAGELVTGTICGIHWHFKQQAPFFDVAADGKRLSKRYWEADFLDTR